MKITLNATVIQIIGRVISAYFMASYLGIQSFVWACLIGWICMLSYEFPKFWESWKESQA